MCSDKFLDLGGGSCINFSQVEVLSVYSYFILEKSTFKKSFQSRLKVATSNDEHGPVMMNPTNWDKSLQGN